MTNMELILQAMVFFIGLNGLIFFLLKDWWNYKVKELNHTKFIETCKKDHSEHLELMDIETVLYTECDLVPSNL